MSRRRDWIAPYRKPAFGPTEGHKHSGCQHPCVCYDREAMDCKKCRAANFKVYRDSLA